MQILIITNGREDQTTGMLFRALSDKIAERHEATLLLRPFPRGLWGRLRQLFLPGYQRVRTAARSETIILHTLALFSIWEVLIARLRGRRVLIFLWDLYPESWIYMRGGARRFGDGLVRRLERFCLRRADRVLIPTADFLTKCDLDALPNTEVFAMWPAQQGAPLPPARRPAGGPLRVAFSGQINAIRDLPGAVRALCRAFDGPIELCLFSRDDVALAEGLSDGDRERLTVRRLGYLSEQALAQALSEMDAGLVSLDPSYALPAFPSKLYAYLHAGAPILFHGPADASVAATIEDAGVGLSLATLADGAGGPALDAIWRDFPERRDAYWRTVELGWGRLAQIL